MCMSNMLMIFFCLLYILSKNAEQAMEAHCQIALNLNWLLKNWLCVMASAVHDVPTQFSLIPSRLNLNYFVPGCCCGCCYYHPIPFSLKIIDNEKSIEIQWNNDWSMNCYWQRFQRRQSLHGNGNIFFPSFWLAGWLMMESVLNGEKISYLIFLTQSMKSLWMEPKLNMVNSQKISLFLLCKSK